MTPSSSLPKEYFENVDFETLFSKSQRHFKKSVRWPLTPAHACENDDNFGRPPTIMRNLHVHTIYYVQKYDIYIIIYTHSKPQLSPDANMSSFSNDGLRPKPPPLRESQLPTHKYSKICDIRTTFNCFPIKILT